MANSSTQLIVPRALVEACDVSAITRTLDGFLSELNRRNSRQNRVEILIHGYNDDPREIYDIPEVRQYFQTLWKKYPGLLYWIDMSSPVGELLRLFLWTPLRTDRGLYISIEDENKFFDEGILGLHIFCDEHNLDPKPSLWQIGRWLGKRLFDDQEWRKWEVIGGGHPWEGIG